MWLKAQDGTLVNLNNSFKIEVEKVSDSGSGEEPYWRLQVDSPFGPVGFVTLGLYKSKEKADIQKNKIWSLIQTRDVALEIA